MAALSLCAAAPVATQAATAQVTADAGDRNPLDELVVTADKAQRTLRNTASSVVVRTATDVDNTPGAGTVDDILARVPNIVAIQTGNNAPAIRGLDGTGPAIGADAFFAGSRPRLDFQVDGRTLTFNEVVYLDGILTDLDQIEVYRGPQSTLFGRNAIGGVVAMKTADPTFDWHGRARIVGGQDDMLQASAAIGGPIIPGQVAFRIAGDYRQDESFVHFTPYPGISDPDRYQSEVVRAKLLVTPAAAPGFRALLTYSYTDAYAPQSDSVTRPFDQDQAAFPDQPRFRTRANVGIADLSWKANDNLSAQTFITATGFQVNRYADPGTGIAEIDGAEVTAEPRLRFRTDDDRITGFLAGYVFHARQHESIDLFGGGLFQDHTDTRAVFGETTMTGGRLALTLGARYEEEDRYRAGGSGLFIIDYKHTFKNFLPKATVTVKASDDVTVGATISRGYNGGGAGFSYNPPFPSYVYDQETVWNYEGFARTALLDHRLELSANVFYNRYHNLQLPFDVSTNPALQSLVIRNADRATTYGAEAEARYHVSPALEVYASGGLLKTHIDRYDDPTVQGNALPRSPAFSATAGFTAHPLKPVDVSFDVHYTDAYYSDVFNNARGKTSPYAMANIQLGYRFTQARTPVRVFVAVTNLFGATAVQQITPGATFASDVASVAHPRRVQGGIEASF